MHDIQSEILTANYWENFKFAKDLSMVYSLGNPLRVNIENELLLMRAQINAKKKIWK